MANTKEPSASITETVVAAWRLFRSDMRPWLVFTQVVSLFSSGVILLQDLLLRLTGTGFLLGVFLLWPFYAALYSAALRLFEGRFEVRQLFEGFSSLWRSLGLTLIHSLISLFLFLPSYMIISFYIFSKLGWTQQEFQSLSSIDAEKLDAFRSVLRENWLSILLIALPAWPLQLYVQSRLFLAYHYVVHYRRPVLASISHSWQETNTGQMRRFLLVWIAELSFPVLFPLFFITYPLKYAIYAVLLSEIEGRDPKDGAANRAVRLGGVGFKNPYVDSD